jgi:adenylate cyclase
VCSIALTRWATTAGLERGALDLLLPAARPAPGPRSASAWSPSTTSFRELGLEADARVPRSVHAELIRKLKAQGASAVAFDVLFDIETSMEADLDLEAALAETRNVVLGVSVMVTPDPRFTEIRTVEPLPPLAQAAAALGEVNFPTDPDGVIRSAWPVRFDRPGLALAAYELATGDTSQRESSRRLLDYYGGPRRVRTVSLYQALDPTGSLPPGFFRDKIVFVGAAQESATHDTGKDAFPTPYTSAEAGTTYGVEIHATLAGNLLEKRRIRLLPDWIEMALLLLLPTAASLAFIRVRPLWGGLVFLLLLPGPLLAGWLAFARDGLDPGHGPHRDPASTCLRPQPALVLPDHGARSRAYQAGLRPLPRPGDGRPARRGPRPGQPGRRGDRGHGHVHRPGGVHLDRGEEDGTRDRGHAERLLLPGHPPRLRLQGTLVKYIGDAVFAIWGAPLPRTDHATLACRAALALARSEATRGDSLKTRIGVHTGTMVVGNLGSAQRFDYTAIGDAVNLASRIEGLNKAFGTRALASAETLAQTDGAFLTRSLGRVRVVGRTEPVVLHELLGHAEEGAPAEPPAACLTRFAQGLELFGAGRFKEAAGAFQEALGAAEGKDGPSEAFWRFAEVYALVPPEGEWDGTLVFESK